MPLTLPEIAAILNVSLRQAQRYASGGYRGHVLPTSKVGHSQVVDSTDFEQWLKLTGLGAKEDPEPEPGTAQSVGEPAKTVPESLLGTSMSPRTEPVETSMSPHVPEWCRPANPNGALTNCPHPNSSNWCTPEAMQHHVEAEARKLVAQYRSSGGTTYEYPDDFEI